jgi:hypothetical protein
MTAQQHTQNQSSSSYTAIFKDALERIAKLFNRNTKAVHFVTIILTGFIFGFSVAVGLGLSRPISLLSGVLVAVGVLIAGSLVAYLALQTISLTVLALTAYSVFRLSPSSTFETTEVQIVYLSVLFLAPFLSLVPKVRVTISRFSNFTSLQLIAVLSFAFLVRDTRISRPSDGNFALSQMFGAEDNAGIVAVLAKSLEYGYSSHAFQFGEFFNGIYLTVAGLISWFGKPQDIELVAALTHWNVTTLFLAWAPIAVMVAIVFSGRKLSLSRSIISFLGTTTLSVLLLWPFVTLGHTTVISSGLAALCLLAISLNRDWAIKNPLLLMSTATALASIIAITWFPLMPFTAASIGLIFLSLLQIHRFRKDKKTFLGLIGIFLAAGAVLLPGVLILSTDSPIYLAMPGGTRPVGEPLILGWLALAAVVSWVLSKKQNKGLFGSRLFLGILLLLLASNLYLFLTGLANNAGQPGYGALKYLMTSIAFSTPLLWFVLSSQKPRKGIVLALLTGVALIFAVITFQYDSRSVGSSFVSESQPANVAAAQSGVFLAIGEALSKNPEQIFCVTDFELHSPDAEQSASAYLCTRWAQSLVGDEGGQEWRFVPLGRIPEESLTPVLEAYKDKEVVIIRFTDPSNPLEIDETWWSKYVDESWEVISVR